jgi:hypothetical protein
VAGVASCQGANGNKVYLGGEAEYMWGRQVGRHGKFKKAKVGHMLESARTAPEAEVA